MSCISCIFYWHAKLLRCHSTISFTYCRNVRVSLALFFVSFSFMQLYDLDHETSIFEDIQLLISFRLILAKLPQPCHLIEFIRSNESVEDAGIRIETRFFSRKMHPTIDEVWRHVLSLRNAMGNLKYCTLAKVVKACLAFPHWNADAERSSSANKNTVTAERSSLHEDTITAIRLIKDGMRHSGKPAPNIEVTNDTIHRTHSAHRKYKAFLEEQKKEWELKAQKKKAAEEKAVQRAEEDEEKAQKEREAKQKNDKFGGQRQRTTRRIRKPTRWFENSRSISEWSWW